MSNNCVESPAPTFSGVVGSGRGGGVNVGSRVRVAGAYAGRKPRRIKITK